MTTTTKCPHSDTKISEVGTQSVSYGFQSHLHLEKKISKLLLIGKIFKHYSRSQTGLQCLVLCAIWHIAY